MEWFFRDQSLAFADFRAAERTFQLLSQVAGRAGRGGERGNVVLQTYQPQHPSVRFAASHDYASFYRFEIEARRELGYAPFSRMVAVRLSAADDQRCRRAAGELARLARRAPAVASAEVTVLGPSPAPLARIRGRYRHRILLRSAHRGKLRVVAAALVRRIDEGFGPVRIHVDVDPVSML